ncbi:DUF6959 family protein [Planosporangium sp. 12N6]|uniref:DUF6959 family protein n=1 Tax=Planosporangium spinosum TaxID=3402278 RepID=UPI003CF7CC87
MERVEVDLHTGQHNFAVLRLPARRFPGVLVQGDSLYAFWQQVGEIQSALRVGDLEQAREVTDSLVDDMGDLLGGYIEALDAAGIGLPFSRPTSSSEQPIEQPSRRTMADTGEPQRQVNEDRDYDDDGVATDS